MFCTFCASFSVLSCFAVIPFPHFTFPCCHLFLPCLISLHSWGCSTIAVKSCSACSGMQFLFIHIMGLVVWEAEFGVTLTLLLCREFIAAEKNMPGFFTNVFHLWIVFLYYKTLNLLNVVIVVVWGEEMVRNSISRSYPGRVVFFSFPQWIL